VPALAQLQFVDVSRQLRIGRVDLAEGWAAGFAAADYDGDGDIDLYLPTDEGSPNRLYQNQGGGIFIDVAEAAGVASHTLNRVALFFDYDGDRRLDLITGGDCFDFLTLPDCDDALNLHLYRQLEDGTFIDTTYEAHIRMDIPSRWKEQRGGISAGDLNNDGYLDLVFANFETESRVLINNKDGTFRDHFIDPVFNENVVRFWQHVIYDFDGDGWQDILTAHDRMGNHLWLNQTNNVFIDFAPSVGLDNPWEGMGITLGDYDNDSDLDIYITNIGFEDRHNVLHRNDSVGPTLHFEEVSVELNAAYADWSWGCTFFDADNDGWLDLAVTNGIDQPSWRGDKSEFFYSVEGPGGGRTFDRRGETVGFNDTHYGTGLAATDFNGDGRLDLIQLAEETTFTLVQPAGFHLFENHPDAETALNNYLVVRPRQRGPNHWAIGAVVRVRAGDLTMMRLITAGTSLMTQEPAEAHFGLGTAETVDEVTIEWPDGDVSRFTDIAVNQSVRASKSAFVGSAADPLDINGDTAFNSMDMQIVINAALGYDVLPFRTDVDMNMITDAVDVQAIINRVLTADLAAGP
jgi:hypothetical protein